jgi:hypothetical protein
LSAFEMVKDVMVAEVEVEGIGVLLALLLLLLLLMLLFCENKQKSPMNKVTAVPQIMQEERLERILGAMKRGVGEWPRCVCRLVLVLVLVRVVDCCCCCCC